MEPYLIPRSEADSAWKDILDAYFQEFMLFFYPIQAAEIDWTAGYEVLDKELHAITTDALAGERLVDKLIKVQAFEGEERWILIHLEVQGQSEAEFSQRLFEYYYRLYDRYRKPIMTIAVLTDDSVTWRPDPYQVRLWGLDILMFRYLSTKLIDYEQHRETLLATRNPFGTVVLTHLAARHTREDSKNRFEQKFQLTRRLYERGLTRDEVLNLYKFIDWVMALPDALEIRYNEQVHQLEEEKAMSYITSAERIGIQKGIQQGIEQGIQKGETAILLHLLQCKFRSVPADYAEKIARADANALLIWSERLLEAKTLSEVFEEIVSE